MNVLTHIDTLFLGLDSVKCDNDYLLKKIKNYLSSGTPSDDIFSCFTLERSPNKFYHDAFINKAIGVIIHHNPCHNTKNKPIYLELQGTFFHFQIFARDFINYLFDLVNDYNIKLSWARCDLALDVCYWAEDRYKDGKDIFLEDEYVTVYPLTCPVPQAKRRIIPEFEGHFYSGHDFNYPVIDTLYCGRTDIVLKVYDKDLDLYKKYQKGYKQIYGTDRVTERVWRIEYQLRGDALKKLMEGNKVWNYAELCYLIRNKLFTDWKFVTRLGDVIDDELANKTYIHYYSSDNLSLQTLYNKLNDAQSKLHSYIEKCDELVKGIKAVENCNDDSFSILHSDEKVKLFDLYNELEGLDNVPF